MADTSFVDATVFLGMNAVDDDVRRSCKAFFVHRQGAPIAMSLEEVGRCDQLVWSRHWRMQDQYYPFMDHLHVTFGIRCVGLEWPDVELAHEDSRLMTLPGGERLLMAMVLRAEAELVTVNECLLRRTDLPVRRPEARTAEVAFAAELETLYETALALRIPHGDVSR